MRSYSSRHIGARPRRPQAAGRLGGDILMGLRGPVEQLLGAALRRVGRTRPEVFQRLDRFQDAAFLLSPDGMPVAFRLTPSPDQGRVEVVRQGDPRPVAAKVSGRLIDLLGLFDGSLDADAAFFSRLVQVEGDTEAVVALHNTLEAAELTLADLIGVPSALHGWTNGRAASLLRAVRRRTAMADA